MRITHLVLAAILGLGIIGSSAVYATPASHGNVQLVKGKKKHKGHKKGKHKKHAGKKAAKK